MRIFLAFLLCFALVACSESAGTRRLAGGGEAPPDTTASIADSVLATPIGTVDDRAPRTALVIGNGNYATLAPLENPANDAQLVSRTLRNLGFRIEGGGPMLNLTGPQMRAAVARYRRALASRGGVGVVYFAGHAVQVNGRNWLAPSDVQPRRLADIPAQFVPAEALFGQSGNGRAVNMVILDACRDNPFEAQAGARSTPIPELRGTSAGLSRVVAPPDTLVAFATAPGAVALDGDGANSPYATALARALTQPGARVEDVFINTRNIVERSTNGFQTPWETSSLTKRVVLNAGRKPGPILTSQFDGRYRGWMYCEPRDENHQSSIVRGRGRSVFVQLVNGMGTAFTYGVREPFKEPATRDDYERIDFKVLENGRLKVVGEYQNLDDPERGVLGMYGIEFDGYVDANGLQGAGDHGGKSNCTLTMTRL